MLLANEHRVYREAVAAALQHERPGIATMGMDPADLAAGIDRFHPDLAICSQLIKAIETDVPAWVLLYPEGADLAVMSVVGEQQITHHLTLADLIALIDRSTGARLHLRLGALPQPLFVPPR